jgi:hypothetical protein
MCLHTSQAGTAVKVLRFAKSIDNQFWWFQTPLRHFESELGTNIFKAVESRHFRADRRADDSYASTIGLLDLTPEEVGQLCSAKKAMGQKVQQFVRMIPRPMVSCHVRPVTSDVLRFQIEITPDFEWHSRWHGGAVVFWLLVEDTVSQSM